MRRRTPLLELVAREKLAYYACCVAGLWLLFPALKLCVSRGVDLGYALLTVPAGMLIGGVCSYLLARRVR